LIELPVIDWAPGDRFGLLLPAHPDALRAGGPAFLTRAFHASGVLSRGNRVTAITRCTDWLVGGTGPKVMLSVAYAQNEPGLSPDLFVKFSRSFTDRTRDRVRHHMEPEVLLANISRDPAFPIAVPKCAYADFHHASGTGILITERIPFGQTPVEPHHPKCMDHVLPDQIGHYRSLITALARLAGAHRSGRLGHAVETAFPLNVDALIESRRNPFDRDQLTMRVRRLADFMRSYRHLFPAHLVDEAFLAGFCADAPLLIGREAAIRKFHFSAREMIALCHYNANVDNAWFWRTPDGDLNCGLIDWGNVGQMHVCQSIWGAIGASEPEMADQYLDELLHLFAAEYALSGGAMLDPRNLELHLGLHVMMAGLSTLMAAPRAILSEVPDPNLATDRNDPLFAVAETARVQLKVTISFLNFWHRFKLGAMLRDGDGSLWRNNGADD
jgi:hypothetical protein